MKGGVKMYTMPTLAEIAIELARENERLKLELAEAKKQIKHLKRKTKKVSIKKAD